MASARGLHQVSVGVWGRTRRLLREAYSRWEQAHARSLAPGSCAAHDVAPTTERPRPAACRREPRSRLRNRVRRDALVDHRQKLTRSAARLRSGADNAAPTKTSGVTTRFADVSRCAWRG